jgi:ribosome-associated toxin RatA of RatAB toxin-antitoxin module
VLFAASASATASDVTPSVTAAVEHKGDTYIVVATLHAPVPPEAAWAVLTDFDNMAKFMPSLKTSQIVERSEGKVLVRQTGTMELGTFKMPFESDRLIEPTPAMILSKQVRGNMQRVESTCAFAAIPGGTRVDYRVEMVPKTWIPESIAGPMMRSEIERQFNAVLREILRRKGE